MTPAEESLVPVVPAVSGGVRAGTPEAAAGRRDAAYSRTLRELRQRIDARFVALRYQGLDTIGHYYMGDTQPGVVGDSNDQDRRRHVQALERYYMYIDAEVGAALAGLGPEDLLLVVAGFGMQRQNSLKQVAGRLLGDPEMTGTHDRAPDGFLLAHGAAVQSGRLPRGSIVDVTPTVLYYFGLPVGRDMDGYARTDLFTREFTSERPIAFIPSYSR